MGESGGYLSSLTMTGGRTFLCRRYKRPAVSIGVRLGVKTKGSIVVELELNLFRGAFQSFVGQQHAGSVVSAEVELRTFSSFCHRSTISGALLLEKGFCVGA